MAVQPCAQVLLTQDNLGIRSQYLNARNTFEELFNYGTVPVVNENDTVAVEQLRIGDNDTLSAQVLPPTFPVPLTIGGAAACRLHLNLPPLELPSVV